jgi:hypothetical protein
MKIISCPIAGRSLIVEFEAAASDRLEAQATRQPAAASHGLLLGSVGGNDPKRLHIQHIEPVFGLGEIPEPTPPADPRLALVTLGYYTIRNNGDSLNPVERDFLADSLPSSACLAMVVTGKPDRRMLAEFYLRDEAGLFGATPADRQLLLAEEDLPAELNTEQEQEPAMARPQGLWWRRLGTAAALAVAAWIMFKAWDSRPHAHVARPAHATVRATQRPVPRPVAPPHVDQQSEPLAARKLIPLPDFVLPVQSVRQIQDPPEVAVWYSDPAGASASAAVTAEHRAVLVHPIVGGEVHR